MDFLKPPFAILAIPAIPTAKFCYTTTMGLKKKNEEKYYLSSVMDDAGW